MKRTVAYLTFLVNNLKKKFAAQPEVDVTPTEINVAAEPQATTATFYSQRVMTVSVTA